MGETRLGYLAVPVFEGTLYSFCLVLLGGSVFEDIPFAGEGGGGLGEP